MVTPRRTRVLAVLSAAAVAALGACSDGGDDDAEAARDFCAEVAAAQQGFGGDPFEALQSRDPARVEEELAAVVALYERLGEIAPDAIDTDLARLAANVEEVFEILDRHDFDVKAADDELQQTSLSDPAELDAAQKSNQAIQDWLAGNCDAPPTTPAPPPTTAAGG